MIYAAVLPLEYYGPGEINYRPWFSFTHICIARGRRLLRDVVAITFRGMILFGVDVIREADV